MHEAFKLDKFTVWLAFKAVLGSGFMQTMLFIAVSFICTSVDRAHEIIKQMEIISVAIAKSGHMCWTNCR
jgi:uncharacterized membrane protein